MQCPKLLKVNNYNVSTTLTQFDTEVNVTCVPPSTYTNDVLYIVSTCNEHGSWEPLIEECRGRKIHTNTIIAKKLFRNKFVKLKTPKKIYYYMRLT